MNILHVINSQPLANNFSSLRDRCLIILRLLHLCRSINLGRSWRNTSKYGAKQHLWMWRKGRKRAQLEHLICLCDRRSDFRFINICPAHLLNRYVAETSLMVHPGSKLLIKLKAPFRGLSADSIGRITKEILTRPGVPMSVFGPQSTRGLL